MRLKIIICDYKETFLFTPKKNGILDYFLLENVILLSKVKYNAGLCSPYPTPNRSLGPVYTWRTFTGVKLNNN